MKKEVKIMNYAKGYEKGAVRALHTNTKGDINIKIYDTPNDLYNDVSKDAIRICPIENNMAVVCGKNAEDEGKPHTYSITAKYGNQENTFKFFGNVVVVGYNSTINAFISLTDEQIEEILKPSRAKGCNHLPFRTVFKKPNSSPEVLYFNSSKEISAFLGTDKLMLAEIGDNIGAIFRVDAKQNGESMHFRHSMFYKGRYCEECIYGDVIFVGFDPKREKAYNLHDKQLKNIMYKFKS